MALLMPHLFYVPCHHALPHSATGPYFPCLPFGTYVLAEALLVAFDIPQQIQLQVALAFLTASRTVLLYSSQVTYLCFHLLYSSFSCSSFARSNLLIHAGFLTFLLEFLLFGMFLSLEEVTLDYQSAFLDPSSL